MTEASRLGEQEMARPVPQAPESEHVDERGAIYLDASAVVRWVVRERGWRELRAFLRERPTRVASRIVDVEVRRAVARAAIVEAEDRVEQVLAGIVKLELDTALAASAGRLRPTGLRTLDAIHVATALALGPQLEALVTYDRRLADAAIAAGIEVATPGG